MFVLATLGYLLLIGAGKVWFGWFRDFQPALQEYLPMVALLLAVTLLQGGTAAMCWRDVRRGRQKRAIAWALAQVVLPVVCYAAIRADWLNFD